MLASAPADHYRRALAAILRDEQVDSVITIFIPPLVTDPADVAAAIAEAAGRVGDKPVLGVFMRAEGAPADAGADSLLCLPGVRGARAGARRHLRTSGARGRSRTAPLLDRFDRTRSARSSTRILAAAAVGRRPTRSRGMLAAAGITTPARASPRASTSRCSRGGASAIRLRSRRSGPRCCTRRNGGAVSLNLTDSRGRSRRVRRVQRPASAPT